jgi:hypothetical protein
MLPFGKLIETTRTVYKQLCKDVKGNSNQERSKAKLTEIATGPRTNHSNLPETPATLLTK